MERSRSDSLNNLGGPRGKFARYAAGTLSCIFAQNASLETGGQEVGKGFTVGPLAKVAVLKSHQATLNENESKFSELEVHAWTRGLLGGNTYLVHYFL